MAMPFMTKQLLLNILLEAPPALDNFVPGPNQDVIQALLALAPGQAMYLWGGAGSGRSHLLQAMAREHGGIYVSAASPVHQLQELAAAEGDRLRLVAVDDVDLLGDAAQAALFMLFNLWRTVSAADNAFALLAAGGRAPLSLPLREDLRTRLGWGLVCRLEQLSDSERAQALRDRASRRGMILPEEVLQWILTHLDRDMRRLSALIDSLDQYSLARHRPITLPLLKNLLAGSIDPRNK